MSSKARNGNQAASVRKLCIISGYGTLLKLMVFLSLKRIECCEALKMAIENKIHNLSDPSGTATCLCRR
jgi:hypothetical protein